MANISKFAYPGSQEEHRFKDGTVFRGTSSAWANEQNKSAYDIVIHTDTGYIYQYSNNELVVVANKSTVFSGASSTVGGTVGLVPAPAANQGNYVLKGDGTWGQVSSGLCIPIPHDETETVEFESDGSISADDTNELVVFGGGGGSITLLEVGTTYTLGGNATTGGSATPQAKCLKIEDGKALMQSTGLYCDEWPGASDFSSSAASYFGSLASAITNVYLPMYNYNSGNAYISVYFKGQYLNDYDTDIRTILQSGASNGSSYGYSGSSEYFGSWTGGVEGTGTQFIWVVTSTSGSGAIGSSAGATNLIAPTFTLDLTHIDLTGSTITYKS